MQNTEALQYLKDAELIHSEQAVIDAVGAISKKLNKDFNHELPVVLCVMDGGVVFTGQLLPKLTFPLEFDCIQATRYGGRIEGRALKWVLKPTVQIANRNVLILDDILDEGITLKAVVDECTKQGALSVKIAVLVEKNISKSKPIAADYVGLNVPDRYVFGCGMDINGWCRNLPAIYALR